MCDSCQMLSINGIPCHEIGCPDAWKTRLVNCFECGCEFLPEERGQRTCNDCLESMSEPEEETWHVEDWTGKVMYNGRTFDSFDDARSYIDQQAESMGLSGDEAEEYAGEMYAVSSCE